MICANHERVNSWANTATIFPAVTSPLSPPSGLLPLTTETNLVILQDPVLILPFHDIIPVPLALV